MDEHVQKAGEILQAGGIVAYPTEAVFGIGCDPQNPAAIDRLLRLKQRDPGKGFILIASCLEQLEPYIKPLSESVAERVLSSWPGAVTWILEAADGVPDLLTGGRDTIAVRVSAHPVVIALCDCCGMALISTSANLAGQAPIRDPEQLQRAFGEDVDYIVPLQPGTLDKPTPIFNARTGQRLR